MKNVIYYFTGTGNSLKVAKDIAESLEDTELVRITHDLKIDEEPVQCDRVGLVTPVYMGSLPFMVQEFLEKLKVNHNAYIFIVATCGGSEGIALEEARNILSKNNVSVSAGFSFRLPANNQTSYAPKSTSKQQRLFKNYDLKINHTIEKINNFSIVKIGNSAIMGKIYKLGAKYFNPRESDVNFYSEESCKGCGACAKMCPARNIIIENGKPTWLHRCERCSACLQFCPYQSIQFKQKTKKWGRYRNPYISVGELMVKE